MKIFLATQNQNKVKELQKLLGAFADLQSISPNLILPEETGTTFEENALIKARFIAKTLKCAALSDDSGLSVPLLNNSPGVYSARFAGEGATDADNRTLLSHLLKENHVEKTPAFFTCVLALVYPNGEEFLFKGECQGMVLSEEKGHFGFGYDSMFIPKKFSKTFAEMPAEEKSSISHRFLAIEKLVQHFS